MVSAEEEECGKELRNCQDEETGDSTNVLSRQLQRHR